MPSPFDLGSLIAGRFSLEALAGEGGMGTVYRARDSHSGQSVALKLLQRSDRPQERERFAREAELLSELRHPGIVTYLSHGMTETGQPYLAMEWLEGEDLEKRLSRGALNLSESLTLVRCAAEALAVAHARGVVHRDLKPSNLLLRDGAVERVALLDFGIARQRALSRSLTATGVALGTPAYMAPEQARGERDLTAAVDVFSLGCVLYECLTGQPAFAAEHVLAVLAKILFAEPPRLRLVRPDLPEAVEALLDRMLAREPAARLPDATALLAALSCLDLLVSEAAVSTLEAHAPRAELARAEQFLISVLLATPATAAADTPDAGVAEGQLERLRELATALAALGVRAEALADGSLVATLMHARGAATDQVALAARCALLLKARWPEAAIALCTGRGHLLGDLPVGEALDRAAGLLRELPAISSSGPILLDELTRGLLDMRFHVQTTPSGVYTLTGEELMLDASRPLLGKPTPCVGRESELGMLEPTLVSCVEEAAPCAVLVTAPPGTGKSRLRHEFLRRVEARGDNVLVLLGRGDPMSAGTAYSLLGQALRRLCGILDGESLAIRRDKLARRIAAHLPVADKERVAAFMGELAGVPFPDEDNIKLRAARQDPLIMSDQITFATLDFLRAECAAHPLLLVLEDLHWGDALTVKLVDAALRELGDRPLMVLALARPEVEELFPKLWGSRVQGLSLRPLSRKAGERLVQHVLGAGVPPATVARIVEQSEGNPLFLEELIRSVAEGRGDEAPATVLAMLQARIGRLPAGARRVLRAASIFGAACWLSGVRALLGAPSPHAQGIEEGLQHLLQSEILEERRESRFPEEQEYRFRHALMRDAAYGLLTEDERVEGHRLAGEYLEARGEPDSLVLAEHFVQGQRKTRAIPYFLQAAEQSYEAYDMDATLFCAERGLACGAEAEQRGAFLSLQIAVYLGSARYADVLSLGAKALELLPPGSKPWCRAVQHILPAANFSGEGAVVADLGARLGSVEPSTDAASYYVCVASWLSIALGAAGMKDASVAFLKRAERIAESLGLSDKAAWGYFKAACASCEYFVEEAPGACLLHALEDVQAFQDTDDRRTQCIAISMTGRVLADFGDRVGAETVLRENLRHAERLNEALPLAFARTYLARLLASSAPLERLEEPARLATDVIPTNNQWLVGIAYGVLAEIKRRQGDLPGAEAEARTACEALRPFPPYSWDIVALRLRILLEQGRAAVALEIGQGALQELECLGLAGYGEIHLRLAVAEALHAVGQTDAARAAIDKTIERLRVRVENIPDAAARERYITQVPTHARLLALAKAWLGDEAVRPANLGLDSG
jgi:eukaryotic-like serine/threonine-protein kinase